MERGSVKAADLARLARLEVWAPRRRVPGHPVVGPRFRARESFREPHGMRRRAGFTGIAPLISTFRFFPGRSCGVPIPFCGRRNGAAGD